MEIPNYDSNSDKSNNYKQLYQYMPDDTFRMLICGGSGSGKTNLLYHMLMKPLVFFDQIHLYAKDLEQEKYQNMIKNFNEISQSVGYDVLVCRNNEIVPVENMENEAQRIVIFDDFVCEKNQKPLIDYFIRGRHKNCSVIYLSQSFYGTPKDIRLNYSHFCVYEFPSCNERNLISRELGVDKEEYIKLSNQKTVFIPVCRQTKEADKEKLFWEDLIISNQLV